MAPFTLDNELKKANDTAKAPKFGQMGPSMKDIGNLIRRMGRGDLSTLMAMCTRETG